MPAWYKGGLSPKILMNRRWSEPHLWISSLPFSFLTALQFRTKHFLCSGCIFPPILWFVWEAPGVDWSEQNLWDLSATPGKDKATVTQRAINFCQHQAQTEEAPFFFFFKGGCCSQSCDSQRSPPNQRPYNPARMLFIFSLFQPFCEEFCGPCEAF